MLTTKRPQDPDARRLLALFDRLQASDRATLLAFAEFLQGRAATQPEPVSEAAPTPREIPRPASESVVAAMRRLSETYFMLDKGVVLHEASALMGAHVMQGRPAAAVIDELEQLFQSAYDRSLENPE